MLAPTLAKNDPSNNFSLLLGILALFGTVIQVYLQIKAEGESRQDEAQKEIQERIEGFQKQLSESINFWDGRLKYLEGLIQEVIVRQRSHESQPGHGELSKQVLKMNESIIEVQAEMRAFLLLATHQLNQLPLSKDED